LSERFDQDFTHAATVRRFVGVFRAMGVPQMVIGSLFLMDWEELARFEAGDDAAWDGRPAQYRADMGAALADLMAWAEEGPTDAREPGGEARAEAASAARRQPPAPVRRAVHPDRHAQTAGAPPSLVRRVVAELRQTGMSGDQLARVFALTREELARLEAGEEAVWTGKPPGRRLRALAGIAPLVCALDPESPWPAPPAGDGVRPRWGSFGIEVAEPDESGQGFPNPHVDG
jgi:hypothetical protein